MGVCVCAQPSDVGDHSRTSVSQFNCALSTLVPLFSPSHSPYSPNGSAQHPLAPGSGRHCYQGADFELRRGFARVFFCFAPNSKLRALWGPGPRQSGSARVRARSARDFSHRRVQAEVFQGNLEVLLLDNPGEESFRVYYLYSADGHRGMSRARAALPRNALTHTIRLRPVCRPGCGAQRGRPRDRHGRSHQRRDDPRVRL